MCETAGHASLHLLKPPCCNDSPASCIHFELLLMQNDWKDLPPCHRWDKQYVACYLDDMPHKRLTRPAKVFEYFFDGMRKGRGRENILRLEVGHMWTVGPFL